MLANIYRTSNTVGMTSPIEDFASAQSEVINSLHRDHANSNWDNPAEHDGHDAEVKQF